jgi:hypothetical protein
LKSQQINHLGLFSAAVKLVLVSQRVLFAEFRLAIAPSPERTEPTEFDFLYRLSPFVRRMAQNVGIE